MDKKDLDLLSCHVTELKNVKNFEAADMNGDGKISITDVSQLSLMLQEQKQNASKLKGDVNGDGKIDKSDVKALENYYVGNNDDINFTNADLNDDGKISISDISKLELMISENQSTIKGDVNGDGKIDVINDSVTIVNYVNGEIEADDFIYSNADVNGDGKVDLKDADKIAKFVNREIDSLDDEEPMELDSIKEPDPIPPPDPDPIIVVDPPFTKGVAKYQAEVFGDFTLAWKEKSNEKIFANEQINVTGMSSDGKALRIEYYSTTEKINKVRWVSADAIEEYKEPPVPQKLQDLINYWNGKTWKDYSYLSDVKQCKEFASYIFYQLTGVKYPGSGSTSSNYYNWRLSNLESKVYQVAEVHQYTGLTTANAKTLFENAKSGDFIQMKRGHGGAHSAILSRKNDKGVWFFEANADGKNTIQEKFYSWDDLVKITSKGKKYNVAMSIYRAK